MHLEIELMVCDIFAKDTACTLLVVYLSKMVHHHPATNKRTPKGRCLFEFEVGDG